MHKEARMTSPGDVPFRGVCPDVLIGIPKRCVALIGNKLYHTKSSAKQLPFGKCVAIKAKYVFGNNDDDDIIADLISVH